VRAATIIPADKLVISGNYPVKLTFPARLGFEGAGVVEAVGSAVSDIKVGQRVHFGGTGQLGAWSEYYVVDSVNVVPLPDNVSFEEGSQLTSNPLTVLAILRELNIPEGEFLVQTAAGSNFGRVVIQLAKHFGIKTINIVRRDSQIEELKAIGADHVINYEKSNIVEEINKLTNGAGAKYALDAVAGPLGASLLNAISEQGTVIIYGIISKEPYNPNPGLLLFKSITVKGFTISLIKRNYPEKAKEYYTEITTLLAAKKLSLPYQGFNGVTEYKAAIAHSETSIKGEKTVLLF